MDKILRFFFIKVLLKYLNEYHNHRGSNEREPTDPDSHLQNAHYLENR